MPEQPHPAPTSPTSTPPVATCIDLLGDADPKVRLQMVHELGGAPHVEAAGALVHRFGLERDFFIREALTWAVLRMPDVAMPLVRTALRSPRWIARLQATHTLSKLGDADDAERLIPLVADPVDCVAARGYWAAAQCRNPIVIPALLAALSRGDAEHRNSLLVALTDFGSAAVPGLAAALRHGGPGVQRHAADILAYLGSPTADPARSTLTEAVDAPDADVRLAALNALGQLQVADAWQTIDRVAAATTDRRLQLLAHRLTERRPSERTLRITARRAALSDEPTATGSGAGYVPPQGSWPAPDLGLVTLTAGHWVEVLGPPLARQVEICRPQYLTRADVPTAVLEQVRAHAHAAAVANGKPDALAARMAAGRVEQFIHERVFVEQVRVSDPGGTVDDLLRGKGVRILDFVRLPPIPFEA